MRDYSYTGVLAGYNGGQIDNVKVSGNIYMNETGGVTYTGTATYKNRIGGLVGSNGGQISKCYSTVNVDAINSTKKYWESIGGLVGLNNQGATISECAYSGTIKVNYEGYRRIGGLVGQDDGGTVTNCYSSGTINGGNVAEIIGGLFGGARIYYNKFIFSSCCFRK